MNHPRLVAQELEIGVGPLANALKLTCEIGIPLGILAGILHNLRRYHNPLSPN